MRTLKSISLAFLLGTCAWSALPTPGHAQSTECPVVGISAEEAPPPLPVYDEPPIPAPDYIWTPGYWAWNNIEYYWVPGTWIEPPQPGLLWTPGYWGFSNGVYVFHRGYWGPHVGFYGGIAYGFGYTGVGFQGGYWASGKFFYNRSVTNLGSVNITNVYDKTVIVKSTTVNRVSYNGGTGGIAARPTPEELAADKDPHTPPTRLQTEHMRAASKNSALFITANHGKPAIAATAHAGDFKGPGVVSAQSAAPTATQGETQLPEKKPEIKTSPLPANKEIEQKTPGKKPTAEEKKVPIQKPEIKPPARVEKKQIEEKKPLVKKPEVKTKTPAEKPRPVPAAGADKPHPEKPHPKPKAPPEPKPKGSPNQ